MTWKPISEHQFPWEPDRLTVAVIAVDGGGETEVFVCQCADGGEYYPNNGTLTCQEMGWTPFAWTEAPPAYATTTLSKGKGGDERDHTRDD